MPSSPKWSIWLFEKTSWLASSEAPVLTLLICEPVNEMHFVSGAPAVLRAKNPVRAFATHWALLHASALSWDEMVIFSNTILDVGKLVPPSLTSTRVSPLSAAGWRLCTLSPSNTHSLVPETKSDVRTGVCPDADA